MSRRVRAILTGILILTAYGVLASGMTDSRVVVMLADIVSGASVIGIAGLMFPLFKEKSLRVSVGYLVLKVIEGALMVGAGLSFWGGSFYRDWIYSGPHLYVFIVSGYAFYYLMDVARLIPRYITIWGEVAIAALAIKTILQQFGLSYVWVDFMLVLIITNEVFLAGWLMVKGFKLKDRGEI